MRTWKRTEIEVRCGACPASIPRGAPMQLVHLPGVKDQKRRCERCADGAAPADLPPGASVNIGRAAPSGMTRLGSVSLPFDGKAAALGRDGE